MTDIETGHAEIMEETPSDGRRRRIRRMACFAAALCLTSGSLDAAAADGGEKGNENGMASVQSQPESGVPPGSRSQTKGGGLESTAGDAEEKKVAEPAWQRLDRALALAEGTGKHILVNFYTDWCPNCRRMDERTYRDDGVLKQMSASFIPVKVNAESNRPLRIDGHTVSEAQLALMFRVNSYPTTWFLAPDGRALMPLKGYYGPELFAPVLRFVEGGWYEKMDFDMYMEREKKR